MAGLTSDDVAATTASTDTTSVTSARRPLKAPLAAAAVASLLAGLLHYAAAAGHRSEWTLAAWLFTLLGAFQIVWAAWVGTRRNRRLLVAGAAVNLVALAVWAFSRTVGTPFGHHAGVAEPLGGLHVAAVLTEAVIVGIVLLALPSMAAAPTPEPSPEPSPGLRP